MKPTREKMAGLLTEQRNPRTTHIDRASVREALEMMHREDCEAVAAVGRALNEVEKVVELVVAAFLAKGRLFYVGAGTSGRLGVLDASECPPTFGVPRDQVQGIIAGGYEALHRSMEGAEDSPDDGAAAVWEREIGGKDVLVGIAASSTTPYVIGALGEARRQGAKTAFLTCNPNPDTAPGVDVTVALLVGPEAITGSTRLKAGTATKLVLNMITTTAMIQTGKVYQNLMVDLTVSCNKLWDRSHRIMQLLTELEYDDCTAVLEAAGMKVKTALVMHFAKVNREEAEAYLQERGGFVGPAIASIVDKS